MMEQISDLQLTIQAQQGQKKAFDALVIKYQYRVMKIVARYVRDSNEVFDVTQETFIKAYRAIDRFRGESAFYTWLYRIAVNTAKNHLVAKSRRIPGIDFEIADFDHFVSKNQAKDNVTPERLNISNEMAGIVYDTIDNLPSELKMAIRLREMEGLTYDEIARTMDCPVGTVRSRIFRARAVIESKVQPLM